MSLSIDRTIVLMSLSILLSVGAFGQKSNSAEKQAKRRSAKMIKSGYEFDNKQGLEARLTDMFSKRQEVNEDLQNKYLVVELTTKHEDKQVAEDLMMYKLPVELAARITAEILEMIETELVQSNRYWELGGHDYFLEVQLAIDEVALATALNLAPVTKVYKASRKNNKNYEIAIGMIYDRVRMMDLFIFEAGDYEILDSIYWLHRPDDSPK